MLSFLKSLAQKNQQASESKKYKEAAEKTPSRDHYFEWYNWNDEVLQKRITDTIATAKKSLTTFKTEKQPEPLDSPFNTLLRNIHIFETRSTNEQIDPTCAANIISSLREFKKFIEQEFPSNSPLNQFLKLIKDDAFNKVVKAIDPAISSTLDDEPTSPRPR